MSYIICEKYRSRNLLCNRQRRELAFFNELIGWRTCQSTLRWHYQTRLRYEVSKMTLWDIFVGTMLLFSSRKVSVVQIHISNWENDGKADFNFEVETIKLTERYD